jgi:hypothetical protein
MDLGKILKRVNVVRNLYWFIIYLALTLGFFFFYVTESIKDYKMEKLDQFEAVESFKNINANFNTVKKDLNELNAKNRNILLALKNGFSQPDLNKELAPYFKNIKIINKLISKENRYTKHEYHIKAIVNNPSNFYNFVDAINKSENIIKVEHPITFNSSKSGIETSFKVVVYELSNK